MLIKDIFLKDINRHISGVVKVAQDDDAVIKNEVEEYIITNELRQYFNKFFNHYVETMNDGTDKMGIWISGFFGSGKSHLLKMLAYTIENRDFGTSSAGEIIRGKVREEDAMLYATIKQAYQNPAEVILFNIDSMSDNDSSDSILSVFRRVFYDKLGYLGKVPFIAEMERELDNEGLYEKFKNIFEEKTSQKWEKIRNKFGFYEERIIETLADCYNISIESAENGYRKKEDYSSMSISDFAKIVKEYIDKKNKELNTKKFRILFMVDEVGQFIAQDNNKMLNLQTIVEELGIKCSGSAWVVVTSQEDVESIIGDLTQSSKNEFSKILGRFERFSLSGANTDEVIKKRLLAKNSSSIDNLKNLYQTNVNILRNQFGFTADSATFQQFKNERDFTNSYPFIPYQFSLLQKVFESIRKLGISGKHLSHGERSMLNAFQQACIIIKEKNLGHIVPFYLFYDTVKGFMDSNVLFTIIQASQNESLDDFDVNLLKLLFLIRHIEQIKPNIDNLVILMLKKIDEDKQELKERILKSLNRLEHEVLITKSGENFYFLTNEERDIKQEIKNISIDRGKYSEFIYEVIFNEFYPQIKHRYAHYENDYELIRSVDHYVKGKGEIELKVYSQFLSDETDDATMMHKSQQGALIIRLGSFNELDKELKTYLQTNDYISKNISNERTNSYNKIIKDFREENQVRRNRLKSILEKSLNEADYFIFGEKLNLPKSHNYKQTIKDNLDKIIEDKYYKMHLITPHAIKSQNEIKDALSGKRTLNMNIDNLINNDSVETVILNYVQDTKLLGSAVTLKDCYNHFSEKPYGWKLLDIEFVIACLVYSKKLILIHENQKILHSYTSKNFDLITKSIYQTRVLLEIPTQAKEEDIEKAKKLYKDISGKLAEEQLNDFVKQIKNFILSLIDNNTPEKLKDLPSRFMMRLTAEEYIDELNQIVSQTENTDLIAEFLKQEDSLFEKVEYLEAVKNFLDNQLSNFNNILKFYDFYKSGVEYYNNEKLVSILENCKKLLSQDSPFSLIMPLYNEINEIRPELQSFLDNLKSRYINELEEIYNSLPESDTDFNSIKSKIEKEDKIELLKASLIYLKEEFESIKKTADKIEEQSDKSYDSISVSTKKVAVNNLIPRKVLKSKQDVDQLAEDLKVKLYNLLDENNEIEIG